MFKRILVGSSLCAGLWMLALPTQAQTPGSQTPSTRTPNAQTPSSQTPSTRTPNAQTPAQTRPATPEASPAAPANTQVSDAEIEKFANAIKQFQTIQQDTQQQATQILQGEQPPLSLERYSQIAQSQENPQAAQPSPEVSSQERQSFDRAKPKITELQQNMRQRMEQALASEQLERQRFAEILAMVRQDPGLRQRIEQKLQN